MLFSVRPPSHEDNVRGSRAEKTGARRRGETVSASLVRELRSALPSVTII